MIARAAMVEIGLCVVGDTTTVCISKALAVYTGKIVSTCVTTGTAVINVCFGIDALVAAARKSFHACAFAFDTSAMLTTIVYM